MVCLLLVLFQTANLTFKSNLLKVKLNNKTVSVSFSFSARFSIATKVQSKD